jgi:hypothetical protein
MPIYDVTLSSWSQATGTGAGTGTWINVGNAQVQDSVYAQAPNNLQSITEFLIGQDPSVLGSSFAANEVLVSITISIWRKYGITTPAAASDYGLYPVIGGTVDTTINYAAAGSWPLVDTQMTYTIDSADLATLGITKASLTASFGLAFAAQETSEVGGNYINVDQIAMVFTTQFQTAPVIPVILNSGTIMPPYAYRF